MNPSNLGHLHQDQNLTSSVWYSIILLFMGLATFAAWRFYSYMGIIAVLLNCVYTASFFAALWGQYTQDRFYLKLAAFLLFVDVLTAFLMSYWLHTNSMPQTIASKLPFSESQNKIIFPFFAIVQLLICIYLLSL